MLSFIGLSFILKILRSLLGTFLLSLSLTESISVLERSSFLESWLFCSSRGSCFSLTCMNLSTCRTPSGTSQPHRCYFWVNMSNVSWDGVLNLFAPQYSCPFHFKMSWCCGKLTLHFLPFSPLFCTCFLKLLGCQGFCFACWWYPLKSSLRRGPEDFLHSVHGLCS